MAFISTKHATRTNSGFFASIFTLVATLAIGLVILYGAAPLQAQSAQSVPSAQSVQAVPTIRILGPIDNSSLVTLRGNVHPLARAQYDHGPVPGALPANRLTLVLKRSDQQEAALRQFLESVQDHTSPLYHKFLTPDQFGKQYGVADADIQTLTNWLTSQGFAIAKVGKGRISIEFSGTVDQVQKAFHTSIHSYVVNGEQHYANAVDPQIPTALAPVVAGVASLNNFKPRRMSQVFGSASMDRVTHKAKPLFNDPVFGSDGALEGYYLAVTPGDLSTIYDTKPLLTGGTDGTGVTIGIVGDSNLDPASVQNFRTNFLPAYSATAFSASNIIIDGNDPGINGDAVEAYLDVETAGGVAPNATVNFYTSDGNSLSSGLDLAIARAIDDDTADILNISFGEWEGFLGTTMNINISNGYEQAAAQGITVFVAAGDSGSAGADDPDTESSAVNGLEVSGYASTAFNVAVGGTDFVYPANVTNATLDTYWNPGTTTNPNNNSDFSSALSFIPQQPWNDSNSTLNQSPASEPNIVGGGGGASTCAESSDFGNSINCVAGYAKPGWQVGTGVPADGLRDLPDLSLFAGNGANFSFYAICASAGVSQSGTADCGTNGGPNSLTTPIQISGVGGTSAASPAMAGIMALVVQKYGRQGQANTVLYPLAVQQPTAFHDVTVGSNAVACTAGSPNCLASGFLSGYAAGTGYDQASGLGSVDANVLATNWNAVVTTPTTTTLTVTPTTVTLNDTVTFTVTVAATATGVPNGDVVILTSSTAPGEGGQTFATLPTVTSTTPGSNTVTFTYTALPGTGSPSVPYQVTARYSGDGTFASSTSAPTTMTVAPVASKINILNPDVYTLTSNGFTSTPTLSGNTGIPYGTYIGFDSVPGPLTPPASNPASTVAAHGTVNITDNSVALPPVLPLDASGDASLFISTLAPGAHSLVASYSGDVSYSASNTSATPIAFTVVQAVTGLTSSASQLTVASGQSVTLTAVLTTASLGNFPTGSVVFTNGTTALPAAPIGVTYNPTTGAPIISASLVVPSTSLTSGANVITAAYSGDANYAVSTAAALTITYTGGVAPTGDFTVSAATITFASGTVPSKTSAVTVTPTGGFTGTVNFSACTLSAGFTGGTCTISPTSVDITGTTAAAATITVSSATTTAQDAPRNHPLWLATSSGLTLAAIVFFGIPARRRVWRSMLAAIFCLIAVAAMSACGGGGGGGGGNTPTIPAGTYTATVTATNTGGTLSHPITVTITVQ